MSRKGKMLLLLGSVLLLATLAVLLLAVKLWVGIMPLAAIGMLWAEAAVFGGLMLVDILAQKLHKTFLWAGCGVILPLYGLCAFVYSLIFLLLFPLALVGFMIGHILMLALSAMALILVIFAGGWVKKTEPAHEETEAACQSVEP